MTDVNPYLLQAIDTGMEHGTVAVSNNGHLRIDRAEELYSGIPVYLFILVRPHRPDRVIRHILTDRLEQVIQSANDTIIGMQRHKVDFDELFADEPPIPPSRLDKCPFCGGVASLTDLSVEWSQARIHCTRCEAGTQLFKRADLTLAVHEAIASWQRRILPPPPDEVIVSRGDDGRINVLPNRRGHGQPIVSVVETELVEHLRQWPLLKVVVLGAGQLAGLLRAEGYVVEEATNTLEYMRAKGLWG